MKIIIVFIFLFFMFGCIPKSSANKKANPKINSNLCQINNSENYLKPLPCLCPSTREVFTLDGECEEGKDIEKKFIQRECLIQPLNSIGGYEKSYDNGVTWSSCLESQCSPESLNTENGCVLANLTKSCIVKDGVGIQSSTDGGSTWSSCSVTSCNTGYIKNGNICVLGTITQSCYIQDGVGVESSSDGGNTWSSCSIVNCNTGFTLLNNICQVSEQRRACTNQPANSIGGYELSADAGQHWGADCKNFSCLFIASMINGECVLKPGEEATILDLQYYITKFEQVSASLNNPRISNINVSFTNEYSATNILGTCAYAIPRYVKINQKWWTAPTTTNSEREFVMFHELGHCLLSRGHKSEVVSLADYPSLSAPVSVMNPYLIARNIYRVNRVFYHKELFDETMSTQNVPLYFYEQAVTAKSFLKSLTKPISIDSSKTSVINGKIVCVDINSSL